MPSENKFICGAHLVGFRELAYDEDYQAYSGASNTFVTTVKKQIAKSDLSGAEIQNDTIKLESENLSSLISVVRSLRISLLEKKLLTKFYVTYGNLGKNDLVGNIFNKKKDHIGDCLIYSNSAANALNAKLEQYKVAAIILDKKLASYDFKDKNLLKQSYFYDAGRNIPIKTFYHVSLNEMEVSSLSLDIWVQELSFACDYSEKQSRLFITLFCDMVNGTDFSNERTDAKIEDYFLKSGNQQNLRNVILKTNGFEALFYAFAISGFIKDGEFSCARAGTIRKFFRQSKRARRYFHEDWIKKVPKFVLPSSSRRKIIRSLNREIEDE